MVLSTKTLEYHVITANVFVLVLCVVHGQTAQMVIHSIIYYIPTNIMSTHHIIYTRRVLL